MERQESFIIFLSCLGYIQKALTTKARVQSQASPSEIINGESENLTGFSTSTLALICQYYSTSHLYSSITDAV
jgi:hypothetical protein